MRLLQTVEKLQESARGPQPSRISIVVGGMYGDHGADFALQNRFFAVFATGIACNSSKNCIAVATLQEPRPARLNPSDSKAALPETPLRGGSGALKGWSWRGRYSPVHQLVKKTFLTS